MYKKYLIILLICTLLTGCASIKHKDVAYLPALDTIQTAQPKLNIFVPKNSKNKNKTVLIFVHGGNWNSGNKNIYSFLGRNFAKHDIITIIPSYTLSPDASYDTMAQQIAATILWVKANIAQYNGDPNRIFITGHSAGGHLGALATMNPKYHVPTATIKGIILNDAAGLDMKHYLETFPPTLEDDYLTTWTDQSENWQDASPIYFLNKSTPPLMIYLGKKTYPSIKTANERFLEALKPFQPEVQPILLNKKHVPMVLQYLWPWSSRYDEIIDFMRLH